MTKLKHTELDALVDSAQAREQAMLSRLLDAAKEFYQSPENVQAYDAWRKQKEANSNVANHVNPSPDA